MTEKEYENIAEKISHDMINYKTKTKSLTQVYDNCLTKYISNQKNNQQNKILIKTIHYITILGYDIDEIKPCKFKRYKY